MIEEVVLLLWCAFVIAAAVSIINIIVLLVRRITHNKEVANIKSVLDSWENAEKQLQKNNENKITETVDLVITAKREPFKFGKLRIVFDKLPSLVTRRYLDTRITLRDVQDYVKQYPPAEQVQCTGCHTVCKDNCNHTCGGKCSTVCNSSCHFACVGVCGGGCSGEATAIGTNELGE